MLSYSAIAIAMVNPADTPDGIACQEQVLSPSSLKNFCAPVSPVDLISVPSMST